MKKNFTLLLTSFFITACSTGTILEPGSLQNASSRSSVPSSTSVSSAYSSISSVVSSADSSISSAEMSESSQLVPAVSGLHEILIDVLQKEYRSHARYQVAIEKFGQESPFPHVSNAEDERIRALQALLRAYNLEIPKNPYLGQIIAPDTLLQACRKGEEGERQVADMYKDFLPAVQDYDAVKTLFQANETASRTSHAPLFRNCIERERAKEE